MTEKEWVRERRKKWEETYIETFYITTLVQMGAISANGLSNISSIGRWIIRIFHCFGVCLRELPILLADFKLKMELLSYVRAVSKVLLGIGT